MLRFVRRLIPTFLLGTVLALVNVAGCVQFVLSRPALEAGAGLALPAAEDTPYQVMACRRINFWAKGPRAEPLWLKVLVVANIIPVVFIVLLRLLLSNLSFFAGLSLCARSWVFGIIFFAASTLQWYIVGAWLEDRMRRFFNISV